MKFCCVVAEYNPLHVGHLKQIRYIKEELKAENVIVIMSGNFTQRGEPAVMNKFVRAKQAVLAGADMVIELPTVFAVENAEVFARGAIKTLNSLGVNYGLCFGVESGKSEDYINLATLLNDESKEFKKGLKEILETGVSLAKAKFLTLEKLGKEYDESLVDSPNNVLGLEYTKALLKSGRSADIYPMPRSGDHNLEVIKKGSFSARSIRNVIKTGKFKKVKRYLPAYVFENIKPYPFEFDKITMAKLITTEASELGKIADCTEGLENRLKALSKDNNTVDSLIARATTKRYTSSRIRRILINNLLGITAPLVKDGLENPTFIKVLAVKEERKDLISELSNTVKVPLITRKSDADGLTKTAKAVFIKDVTANDLYNLVSGEKQNEHLTLFI